MHPQLRAYRDNPTRTVRSPKQGGALGIHGALIVKRLLRKDGHPSDVAPALKQSAATDGPGGEHCLPEHLGCKMVGRAGLEPAPSPYKEPALTA